MKNISKKTLKTLKSSTDVLKFEKEFGEIGFIKACISALNHIIIEKGIATKEELWNALEKEMKLRKLLG